MTTNMSIDTGYTILRTVAVGRDSVVVKESAGWRDYLVQIFAKGQHMAYLDYFTTDKAEALQHADYEAEWLRRN